METYLVTYLGDYPCGHRHPLSMEIKALSVMDAIEESQELLDDDDITSINHTLYSIVPVSVGALSEFSLCPPRKEIKLLPCPFCGNDEIEMNCSKWDGDYMYVVRCDCCGTEQPEEYQDTAIQAWNQRERLSAKENK